MPITNDLASGESLGTTDFFQLFAGESDILTDAAPVAAGVRFAKYEVAAMDDTGALIKFDPAGAAPANVARVIVAQPITADGQSAPYYYGGVFNHEALVWPASLDTEAKRKAVFMGSMIHVTHILK
jgi:hypothetical protein